MRALNTEENELVVDVHDWGRIKELNVSVETPASKYISNVEGVGMMRSGTANLKPGSKFLTVEYTCIPFVFTPVAALTSVAAFQQVVPKELQI